MKFVQPFVSGWKWQSDIAWRKSMIMEDLPSSNILSKILKLSSKRRKLYAYKAHRNLVDSTENLNYFTTCKRFLNLATCLGFGLHFHPTHDKARTITARRLTYARCVAAVGTRIQIAAQSWRHSVANHWSARGISWRKEEREPPPSLSLSVVGSSE